MSNEMFYYDDAGNKIDAVLHEEMLKERGYRAKMVSVRIAVKNLGVSEEAARKAFGVIEDYEECF